MFIGNQVFGQCTADAVNITNYCPNQFAEFEIVTPQTGAAYRWFDGTIDYGISNNFNSPSTISPGSGPQSFSFRKELEEIHFGPFPTAATRTDAIQQDLVYNFDANQSFLLESVKIPIKLYNTSRTYGIQVAIGTQFSALHTFTASDGINLGNQYFLIEIPVNLIASQGNGQTLRAVYAPGSLPANTFGVDGFAAYLTSGGGVPYAPYSSSTVDISPTVQSAYGNNSNGGIFEWDVKVLCPLQTVTAIQETVLSRCCTPVSTNPTITSSTGSNVFISPFTATLTSSGSTTNYFQWYKDGVALGSPTLNGRTLTINEIGSYSVREVILPADINKISCYKATPINIQERVLFAPPNQTICLGDQVNLFATGAIDNVQWFDPDGSITDPTAAITTALPTQTVTYTVTATVPLGNLVINGDFENGNTGFTSTYGYEAINTGQVQVGRYRIAPNVISPFSAWTPCDADNTTGSGNFLYTDARTNNGSPRDENVFNNYLWRQTVAVEPNTDYEFSAYVSNFNNQEAEPVFNLYINGEAAYPVEGQEGPDRNNNCTWERVSYTWNSGTNTTAELTISEVNYNSGASGHEFMLDDISFGAPGTQSAQVTITVEDCFEIDATTDNICVNGEVSISATTNGIFIGWRDENDTTVGINDPNSLTTTVEPNGTTEYCAYARFQLGNLIVNPDFELGNQGFTSSLNYSANSVGPGGYSVNVAPELLNGSFLPINDHTSGSGNMLILDAGSADDNLYSTTVSVVAGEDYAFSVWIANINRTFLNPPIIQFVINNVPLDVITFPANTSNWFQFFSLWTSDVTGNITIRLENLNPSSTGNDFAIDDVGFSPLFPITKEACVTVNGCTPPALDLIIDTCSNTANGLNFLVNLNQFENYMTDNGTSTADGWFRNEALTNRIVNTNNFVATNGQVIYLRTTDGTTFNSGELTFNVFAKPVLTPVTPIDYCENQIIDLTTFEIDDVNLTNPSIEIFNSTFGIIPNSNTYSPNNNVLLKAIAENVNGCADTTDISIIYHELPTVTMTGGPAICGTGNIDILFSDGPPNGIVSVTFGSNPSPVDIVLDANGSATYPYSMTTTGSINVFLQTIEDNFCESKRCP